MTELQFRTDGFKQAFIIHLRTNVNMCIKYIQYRILHYRIATEMELVKMKILDDEKCCFCSEVEGLEHLFYTYEKADSLWKDLHMRAKPVGFNNYILDVKTIISFKLRKSTNCLI